MPGDYILKKKKVLSLVSNYTSWKKPVLSSDLISSKLLFHLCSVGCLSIFH